MIHVEQKAEPKNFDKEVRQKGLRWLAKKNIDITIPLPSGTSLFPYWRSCQEDLYLYYGGICAYLAIFFEQTTGVNVEHFHPKSLYPDLAYEWCNYRLSCPAVNSRKNASVDILDPFKIKNDWFYLEFVSGMIFPNPQLSCTLKNKVQITIDRLNLDSAAHREMRARHYQEYREKKVTEDYLKRYSPFVWKEAVRQHLL